MERGGLQEVGEVCLTLQLLLPRAVRGGAEDGRRNARDLEHVHELVGSHEKSLVSVDVSTAVL